MLAIDELRYRFAQSAGLPFSESLTEASIEAALERLGVEYRDRIFTPATTLWAFLSQVLTDDHSCQDAVARIVAHRSAQGMESCSPNTAAYCKARARLPLALLETLARETAAKLESQVMPEWQWKDRPVKIVDGSTLSMPDTPENQAEFPQHNGQDAGVGFPIARIAALFSLSTGACLDLAIAPWRGKGTSERTLFREMFDSLQAGDIVLGDELFDSYLSTAMLRQRGVDVVFKLDGERNKRLVRFNGQSDVVFAWERPRCPDWLDRETYNSLPREMLMRELHFDARGANNRSEIFAVSTSLIDPAIPREAFASIYQQRWQCELDLRSLKSVMRMDILRCKTPEMVRKEIWVHLLAYNLLRSAMLAAASQSDAKPREISFKAAKQTVAAFAPKFEAAAPECRIRMVDDLLRLVAYHRVGDRGGRFEPRANKRRPKSMKLLTVPRKVAQEQSQRVKWG